MHIPEIRFEGFTEPWEQCGLTDVLLPTVRNNTLSRADLNYDGGEVKNIHYGDILTKFGAFINAERGDMPFIKDGLVADFKNNLLKSGDVIFADTAEDETVGKVVEVTNAENINIVSGLHTIVYRPKIKFADCFMGYYLNTNAYRQQLLPLMQGAKVLSLGRGALANTLLRYPSTREEQVIIADFFRNLDDTIAHKRQQHEKTLNIKKAMLEKMFPKKGADVPEVRFEGFSEPWELYKLDYLFIERNERSEIGELISVTISSGVVKASSLGRRDSSSEDKSNYKKVEKGDIAYNSMRMWQGASGVSEYSGILSPAYTVITPNDGVNSLFFSYLFKLPHMIQIFQASSQGMTSDTWTLKFSALKNIAVKSPSYEEQTAIGNFFRNLDTLIEAEQQELEKLQNIKKACLSKMFV